MVKVKRKRKRCNEAMKETKISKLKKNITKKGALK